MEALLSLHSFDVFNLTYIYLSEIIQSKLKDLELRHTLIECGGIYKNNMSFFIQKVLFLKENHAKSRPARQYISLTYSMNTIHQDFHSDNRKF